MSLRWPKYSLRILLLAAPWFSLNAGASILEPTRNSLAEQAQSIQLAGLRQGLDEIRMIVEKSQDVPQLTRYIPEEELNRTDLRGRTLTSDLRDYLLPPMELAQVHIAVDALVRALSFNDAVLAQDQGKLLFELLSPLDVRRANIMAYWRAQNDVEREQRMWSHSLDRNHVDKGTPHSKTALDVEAHLRSLVLTDTPAKDTWKPLLQDWVAELINDRNSLSRRIGGDKSRINRITFNRRQTVCPALPVAEKPVASKKQVAVTVSAATSAAATGFSSDANAVTSARASIKGPVPNIDDHYPPASKREGEEGVVILVMKVSSAGCPTNIAISGYSGSDALDAAALDFAELLTYNPAIESGKPVESTLPLAIVFRLSERRNYSSSNDSSSSR